MSPLADLMRFAICFVLVLAAATKFGGAGAFRETLMGTQLVPRRLTPALAVAIPLLEVGAGVALILSPAAGAITAIALFVGFSTAAELVHRRGGLVQCNCFAGLTRGKLGRGTALQNLLLTVVTIVVLVRSPQITRASLPLGLAGIAIASTLLLLLSTFRQATRSRTSLLDVGATKTRHAEAARRQAA
jgi:hypothetical protein